MPDANANAFSAGILIAFLLNGTMALAAPAGSPAVPRNEPRSFAAENGLDSVVLSQLLDCEITSMTCNFTVSGTLSTFDCSHQDGTVYDVWEFEGTAGQTVVIDLMSDDFNAFLYLTDPDDQLVATDDDSGVGSNSRIVHVLESSGTWFVIANNLRFSSLGDYTLQLQCSSCAAEPPAAPSNLTATTLSATEVELEWQDNSGDENQFLVELMVPGSGFEEIGVASASSTGVDVTGLLPATIYSFRVRGRNADRYSDYSNEAVATTFPAGACSPSATDLCLPPDNRFELSVYYQTAQGGGREGDARAIPLRPLGLVQGGIFAFQDPANPEMLVKVLNGCTINNHYWVFYAATTNVGFELTVTDTQAGESKVYTNPDVQPADAVTDTQAFATCP
ncbi:MAG: hypothetical protein GY722_10405 [bacterium]|nr:hypothetical protein [bacterium]